MIKAEALAIGFHSPAIPPVARPYLSRRHFNFTTWTIQCEHGAFMAFVDALCFVGPQRTIFPSGSLVVMNTAKGLGGIVDAPFGHGNNIGVGDGSIFCQWQ